MVNEWMGCKRNEVLTALVTLAVRIGCLANLA